MLSREAYIIATNHRYEMGGGKNESLPEPSLEKSDLVILTSFETDLITKELTPVFRIESKYQ